VLEREETRILAPGDTVHNYADPGTLPSDFIDAEDLATERDD
jgi:hypothetical protein